MFKAHASDIICMYITVHILYNQVTRKGTLKVLANFNGG